MGGWRKDRRREGGGRREGGRREGGRREEEG